MLRRTYPDAQAMYDELREENHSANIDSWFDVHKVRKYKLNTRPFVAVTCGCDISPQHQSWIENILDHG
jgi:hypothetical protein